MSGIAIRVTDYLIANQIVKAEKREEYIYGLSIFGLKYLNYLTLVVLSIFLEIFIPTIFFMGAFLTLRGWTGGYHANSVIRCYLGTIGIYLLTAKVFIPLLVIDINTMTATLIIASIIIFLFAPINHINLNLSEKELAKCKSYSKFVLGSWIFIIVFLLIISVNRIIIAFSIFGIVLDAGLLLIQKIVEGRKSDEE